MPGAPDAVAVIPLLSIYAARDLTDVAGRATVADAPRFVAIRAPTGRDGPPTESRRRHCPIGAPAAGAHIALRAHRSRGRDYNSQYACCSHYLDAPWAGFPRAVQRGTHAISSGIKQGIHLSVH